MAKPTSPTDVFDLVVDAEPAGAEPAGPEPAPTAPGGAPAVEPPAPGRSRRMLTVAVGAVAVAGLGSSAYLGWQVKELNDCAAAGHAAITAARDYAVALTTLDAKDIDGHYQRALDGATGQFKDEYSRGAAQLRQLLIDNKAAGTGLVIDAAVKSATKTRVETLLFVDQSVRNAVSPGPRLDRNRVQMTMQLVDGRWLASKVDLV